MTQTVTALFDNRREAETAIEKLVQAGIDRNAIRLTAGAETANRTTTGSYDHQRDAGGFWSSLKDLFLPEEDRYAYSEGLSRGGTLVSVKAEDGHADRVSDLLEGLGSVHLEERETSWRKEGWTGYTAGSGASGTATSATGSSRDETIPVVEETLQVGKRAAESGRVRVRSYVVETPVNEQVTLHNESVHVERRPVDRSPTPSDERLFAEKTIEATTRSEQAVVSKEARVVEEVGLRRDATERTETVSDTVRRTEVEVEDERGNVSRTGTTGVGKR
ncbi:YsnF/AvaK domain-containing protein [uncultured Methylobacterium sp.]|uniref:YsnF/AvaK domain-containing protein n=1 Tax=uncultured Methylobacterium sp. TaxID=157278 RepID=UPI0035CC93BA